MSHCLGELVGVFDVQKLIRTMGICTWTKNSSNDKLSLRPNLVQKSHQWNRSSFSLTQHLATKVFLTGLFKSIIKPFTVLRAAPSISSRNICKSNFSSVRRIGCEKLVKFFRLLFSIKNGWASHTDPDCALR